MATWLTVVIVINTVISLIAGQCVPLGGDCDGDFECCSGRCFGTLLALWIPSRFESGLSIVLVISVNVVVQGWCIRWPRLLDDITVNIFVHKRNEIDKKVEGPIDKLDQADNRNDTMDNDYEYV